MSFKSVKTYPHSVGLSVCFRQWRAQSHCSFLHGYALEIEFEFSSMELDENNWVIDFGALVEVRDALKARFDHKLVVAADDPERETFERLDALGIAEVVVMPRVSCEMFAQWAATIAASWLVKWGYDDRVALSQVTVREHGANAAVFIPD